jgi:hypothetical protein
VEVELDPRKGGRPRLDGDAPNAGKARVGGVGRLRLVDKGEMGGIEVRDQLRLDPVDQGVDDQAADGSQAGGASDRDGLREGWLPVMVDPGVVQRPSLP